MEPLGRVDAKSPAVVLGAGYAGLRVAQELSRRSRGRLPVILVDRHPVHVLRTELYEIDELARTAEDDRRFLIPLSTALNGHEVRYREGLVERIDLAERSVTVGGSRQPFGALVICLGSVPAFYNVPGAREIAHQVYGYLGARRLALTLKDHLTERATLTGAPRLRVAVVGGGSTGTEVAAEIATSRWSTIIGKPVAPPEVTLVTGSAEFLAGMPAPVIEHARTLMARAHVQMLEHVNVARVGEAGLSLTSGVEVPFDLVVWCAGVQAPGLVRGMAVDHGHSGRIRVDKHLELPGHPGVFAVGDVAELVDPRTSVAVPATAQAALAEAPMAARNLLARARGRPLTPFVYRERGAIVSVGLGQAAGRTAGITVWGRPAALVKKLVEKGYDLAADHGRIPRGL